MEPGSMSFVFTIFFIAVAVGTAAVAGMVWLFMRIHSGKSSAHGH